jgi:hypothetical protein
LLGLLRSTLRMNQLHTKVPLFHSIQPIILELMECGGKMTKRQRHDLFPKLVEATKDLPRCTPVMLVGFGKSYFLSPFSVAAGPQHYISCTQNGVSLAITLLDCISMKFSPRDRLSYLRAVMPRLMQGHRIPPRLRVRIQESYFNADASIIIAFLEDLDEIREAVANEGATLYESENARDDVATKPISSNC